MNRMLLIAVGITVFFLGGCAHNAAVIHNTLEENNEPKKLAVFLDGTANDEGSHTNVSKLHNLITSQSNTNISAVYIEGVGTDWKVFGMAMGWGIGHDVREAYLYLAKNHDPKRKDEIYIFGFSRGAFAARILAALVHVAGIPDISKIPEQDQMSFVEKIYDAYKGDKSIMQRRQDVMAVTGKMPESIDVEFMGIWDSVEALGWPDYKENIDVPNPRYADQLCNIKKAAHAVSIDDDRARIFTPILLTRDHLIKQCASGINLDDVVNEVWFSGAHSDVGGGYSDTDISGVSLNWMISQIKPYNLVPDSTKINADPYGKTHDPESGLFGLIYHKKNRNLPAYTDSSSYNHSRLKIHQSVLDRLAKIPVKTHESHWFESDKYRHCFKDLSYLTEKNCFDVINYN